MQLYLCHFTDVKCILLAVEFYYYNSKILLGYEKCINITKPVIYEIHVKIYKGRLESISIKIRTVSKYHDIAIVHCGLKLFFPMLKTIN